MHICIKKIVILNLALLFVTGMSYGYGKSRQSPINKWLNPNHDPSFTYLNLSLEHQPFGTAIDGGTGFEFGLGFNLFAFNLPKTTIAPFCSFGVMWGNSYNQIFQNKLKNNIELPQKLQDQLDGAGSLTGQQQMDYESAWGHIVTMAQESAQSTFNLRYGLLIRTPYSFVPPLKLYGLLSRSKSTDNDGATVVDSGTGTPISSMGTHKYFERWGYGIEAMIYHPYQLTDDMFKFYAFSISIYAEYLDIANSRIWDGDEVDVLMNEFVTDDFLNDYGQEYRVGIKMSFQLM